MAVLALSATMCSLYMLYMLYRRKPKWPEDWTVSIVISFSQYMYGSPNSMCLRPYDFSYTAR